MSDTDSTPFITASETVASPVAESDAPSEPTPPEIPEPPVTEPSPDPSPEPVPLPTDRERLAAYLEAERAVLLGHQSYTVDGHTYTRADLGQLQQAIMRLRQSLALSGGVDPGVGGIRTTQVVF